MPTSTYDMAASDNERRPTNRYIEYLHMAHSRRLLRGPAAPAKDGAGLLAGARHHGRAVPIKGKGLPPIDGKQQPDMITSIRLVPGPWNHMAETDIFHTRRPVTPGDLSFRTSVRTFTGSFESSMKGAAAIVVDEEPARRPLRRHGAEAPEDGISYTKRRVQVDTVAVDGTYEWWEQARPSSVRTWALPARPVTIDTIIRHRYSDPDSDPLPAKLDAERAPAPTVGEPVVEAVKEVFSSATVGYCANKGRAMYGSTFRFG
ncbi:MAG: hypothetical protein J3K34DRAFT_398240 [Monoraphidium minutum]|nr:MAG: hypothetical protein J3K34DRAFT_398240 [Monoraphidium minutum]